MTIWKSLTALLVLSIILLVPMKNCEAGFFSDLFGKKERVVGTDIKVEAIQEFYYTISSSTNPPEFQRYRIKLEKGQASFYHEKREGDHWPLRESDITVHGTVALTAEQLNSFLATLNQGIVTKRVETPAGGGRGPYLYLYWQGDEGKYQVFTFADYSKRQAFEKLCLELKQNE